MTSEILVKKKFDLFGCRIYALNSENHMIRFDEKGEEIIHK